MAFKLIGDQYKEINLVQKRRVEELLASNIPEDEALLMKNGRFVCLLCKHKPTFDTVAMLSIHRSGQKHIRAAHTLLQQRQSDREELEKREHLQMERKHTKALIEDAVPLLAKTQAAAKHATLSSTPYSSLSVKSHKDMEGESKPQPFFTRKRQRDETSKQPTDGATTNKKSHTDHWYPSDEVVIKEDKIPETPLISYVFPRNISKTKKNKGRCDSSQEVSDSTGAQKRLIYMQRKSAGWLYNPDGTWSKDSNVEFDSDEDVPS